MASILIVDDEMSIRHALQKFLKELGYSVFAAADGIEALQILERQPIDLALVDLVMPRMDGIHLIRKMKVAAPDLIPIVLTGFGTITSAVEAMKAGAYHYLTKPFELDDIAALVKTALSHKELISENRALRKTLHDKYRFDKIVGKSDAIQNVFNLVEKVAETDSTVLILGDSGTGKELIAKAIHFNSRRRDKPFVAVNCAAIPEELLESELFGHMKGSFTGAIANKEGRFAVAHGGTIFLDEIGDMSPKLQTKLLRVLQERRFEPVGSTQPQDVDVRILAATNQNLEQFVKKGIFREDLYYRLNVIPLSIPPLRERKGDVLLLLAHFLDKFRHEHNKNIPGYSRETREMLMHYPWPGNVRELENTVERLVILKERGEIVPADLPEKIRGVLEEKQAGNQLRIPDTGLSFKAAMSDYENEILLRTLEKTGWNKNRAAVLLKLNRTTLVEKIKKKKLERKASKRGGEHVQRD